MHFISAFTSGQYEAKKFDPSKRGNDEILGSICASHWYLDGLVRMIIGKCVKIKRL